MVARVLGMGCLCATLSITPLLTAQPAATSSSTEPAPSPTKALLLLTVAGSSSDEQALASIVSELLARLGVTIRLELARAISLSSLRKRDARDTPYLAHGFVDLTDPGHATLYLLDPDRDRLLVRQLTHTEQESELLREELAHILETSIEGLLSGARIGQERALVVSALAPPSPTAPAPTPAPVPRTPRQAPARDVESVVRVAALYEVGIVSAAPLFAHGPAAAVLLRVPGAARWGGMLAAGYRFPIRVAGPQVSARLLSGALRVLGTWHTPLGSNTDLILGVGAGVDFTHIETRAIATDVTASEPHWLSIAILRASLAVDRRLSAHLSGFLALAADVDPQHTRYVLDRASGDSSVFEPWAVRPSVSAGIGLP